MNIYPLTVVQERDLYTLALAGKRCYSSKPVNVLWEEVSQLYFTDIVKFLNKLISAKHLSILEHFNFTFGVDDVTRVFTHQLVRHRHFSYAQMSHRYTDKPELISCPEKVFDNYTVEMYNHDMDSVDLYQNLVKYSVPAEEARLVLPGTTATSIFITGNLRSWIEFLNKRTCMCAQKEIRTFAKAVHGYFITNPVLSAIFYNPSIGPDCITPTDCPSKCKDTYYNSVLYYNECSDLAGDLICDLEDKSEVN